MSAALTGEPTIRTAPAPAALTVVAEAPTKTDVKTDSAEPVRKPSPKLPLTPEPCLPEVRVRGTVKFFIDDQGYGFISRDDGEKDCYVNYTSVVGKNDGKLWPMASELNLPRRNAREGM